MSTRRRCRAWERSGGDERTYPVQVFRGNGSWIVEVPELRAVGQARTLTSGGDTARELVALWLDVPVDQV